MHPASSIVTADLTGNGAVGLEDVQPFYEAWVEEDARADVDENGNVNVSDIDTFEEILDESINQ